MREEEPQRGEQYLKRRPQPSSISLLLIGAPPEEEDRDGRQAPTPQRGDQYMKGSPKEESST